MIDLTPFCCADENDPGSASYERPFRFGDFVYATDRYIAIRVPAADYPDVTAHAYETSNVPALIDSLNWPAESECTINWPIALSGMRLRQRHLDLIDLLPRVMVSPVKGHLRPVRFRFDGGQGMVMPMRE